MLQSLGDAPAEGGGFSLDGRSFQFPEARFGGGLRLGLKARREAKTEAAPRALLAAPRRIFWRQGENSGGWMGGRRGLSLSGRARGCRAHRVGMRQSRPTASQAEAPLRWRIRATSCGAQKYLLFPRQTLPKERRLCSSASVASRRLAPGLRPPPLAHRIHVTTPPGRSLGTGRDAQSASPGDVSR